MPPSYAVKSALYDTDVKYTEVLSNLKVTGVIVFQALSKKNMTTVKPTKV